LSTLGTALRRARTALLLPALACGAAAAAQQPPAEQPPRGSSPERSAGSAPDAPSARGVDELLAELQRLESTARQAGLSASGPRARRAALALELLQLEPGHPQLATLMPQRWDWLISTDAGRAVAADELQAIIAAQEPAALVSLAWYWSVQLAVARGERAEIEAAVAAFRARYPKDPKGARMLLLLAAGEQKHPERALAIYREVLEAYPDDAHARFIPGRMRRVEALGRPLPLRFQDVATGQDVDVASLRGRPVLIHVWSSARAGWEAGQRELAAVRARLGADELAIVGVDLGPWSEAGAAGARARLAACGADWPQWHPAGGAEGEVALAWGLDDAPVMLVLDRDGRLVDGHAEARLERVLTGLLEEQPAAR
jgi:hypothetical protein